MRKFTKDHEWVDVQGDEAVIGITDHAQAELGDIVFVELPAVGDVVEVGQEESAVIESVKAAGGITAPVSGEVVAINEALIDEPSKVNTDAEGDGWFFRVKLADKSQLDDLMDEAAYKAYLGV
ncbi:glycine cleavage system protein GcvH [Dichelobacter nodosus]|uniref:Glycine cleavage system H protein n=1 Tax=Dichelobacter nodosus (strain VCS1703A) TaxID=246195 RepID=A5EXS8_DICNV|nr:glycine cleavage system protein GcvH [Dichelobacter nodosus]ABQ13721.1 glycine cleavage system protein H [Dichelobacter nodosus VCS1703A]AXM45850.1 glycine cleavage system protein GcvH [Dichelobacter nodosus]KNZ39291.1 glycine cleavage system protein H [Dichelobacter nodosus]TGA64696.1 glycine cleavage system protein GcvH [Dichelobacter nodosus]